MDTASFYREIIVKPGVDVAGVMPTIDQQIIDILEADHDKAKELSALAGEVRPLRMDATRRENLNYADLELLMSHSERAFAGVFAARERIESLRLQRSSLIFQREYLRKNADEETLSLYDEAMAGTRLDVSDDISGSKAIFEEKVKLAFSLIDLDVYLSAVKIGALDVYGISPKFQNEIDVGSGLLKELSAYRSIRVQYLDLKSTETTTIIPVSLKYRGAKGSNFIFKPWNNNDETPAQRKKPELGLKNRDISFSTNNLDGLSDLNITRLIRVGIRLIGDTQTDPKKGSIWQVKLSSEPDPQKSSTSCDVELNSPFGINWFDTPLFVQPEFQSAWKLELSEEDHRGGSIDEIKDIIVYFHVGTLP